MFVDFRVDLFINGSRTKTIHFNGLSVGGKSTECSLFDYQSTYRSKSCGDINAAEKAVLFMMTIK